MSPTSGGIEKKSWPILEKVVSGSYPTESAFGPKSKVGCEVGEGLTSFDGACRNVREAKFKPKKTKIVEGLGDRVRVVPSFYNCLVPKSNQKSQFGSFLPPFPEHEDISNCSSHLGNSMTNSKVVRCNNMIRNKDSEVGGKIWETISNLGIVSRLEERLCIKEVEAMEERDKEEHLIKNELNKVCP